MLFILVGLTMLVFPDVSMQQGVENMHYKFGNPRQNCDDACAADGRVCDFSGFSLLNNAEVESLIETALFPFHPHADFESDISSSPDEPNADVYNEDVHYIRDGNSPEPTCDAIKEDSDYLRFCQCAEKPFSCPPSFHSTSDPSMCLLAVHNYVTVQSDALVNICQDRDSRAVLASYSTLEERDTIISWLSSYSRNFERGEQLFWTGFRLHASGDVDLGGWKDSYGDIISHITWAGHHQDSGQHCARFERKDGSWRLKTNMCNTCIYPYQSRKPKPLCMIKKPVAQEEDA